MQLTVLGSGSSGNCYILENDNEALIIEAGVAHKEIKLAINFNIAKIAGCIISHEHKDHSNMVSQLIDDGIKCFTGFKANGIKTRRQAETIKNKQLFNVGGFKIYPFDVPHDVLCFGFVISHKDIGLLLFLTDLMYSPITFKNLSHILIESNYSKSIIDENRKKIAIGKFDRNTRVIKSHLSLESAVAHLKATDLSNVSEIVLLHLSNENSDEAMFKKEVMRETGKPTYIAKRGLKLQLFNNITAELL